VKNVLDIVSYKYLPYTSGGQKCIALLLEYLGMHTPLFVVGTNENDVQLVNNYKFYPLLKKGILKYADPSSIFRLKAFIKRHKIEVVMLEQPFMGWLGVVLKFLTGAKLIIRSHNIEYIRFKTIEKPWWYLLKIYETWVLRNADIVFSISDEDRDWMINKMGIPAKKCITIPYGIIQDRAPANKQVCKEKVCALHGLNPTTTLLFFNGMLNYAPNTDALKDIIFKINPLLQNKGFTYTILVAGKNLPDEFNNLKAYNNQHIYFAGFVEDIDLYTEAADVFLNPVNTGGGVKTKMIEALGMNTTVISTINGAMGVDKSVCGNKLKIVNNDDWEGFAEAIIQAATNEESIPPQYYTIYHWANIVNKLLAN
jgi:glycosyltransferase involved in cell wall biosynthesis